MFKSALSGVPYHTHVQERLLVCLIISMFKSALSGVPDQVHVQEQAAPPARVYWPVQRDDAHGFVRKPAGRHPARDRGHGVIAGSVRPLSVLPPDV